MTKNIHTAEIRINGHERRVLASLRRSGEVKVYYIAYNRREWRKIR